MRFSIRPLALLLIGNTLFASDGVLEINQACAVNTGCIATDSAGFPVQITAGGSYVLSGNLDLTSTPGVNAIEVNASEVNLNLAGFRIFGPTSCSGTPGVDFLCSPLDIDANGISIAPGAVGTTIRNGTIRGMPGSGISGSDSVATRVSELLVTENGNDGIDLGDKAQVSETRAIENRLNGIELGDQALVSHATVSTHGSNGIVTGNFSPFLIQRPVHPRYVALNWGTVRAIGRIHQFPICLMMCVAVGFAPSARGTI